LARRRRSIIVSKISIQLTDVPTGVFIQMGKKCQYEVWKGMLAGLTYLTSSTARTLRDSAILVKHVKFEAAP
jgi:hypothetical protein